MIMDQLNVFVEGVEVAGAAGNRNAGDVIDLFEGGGANGGAPAATLRDVGQGRPVYLVILVTVAPADADTVEFRLVSDAEEPPNTTTATVHLTSGAIAVGELPAGTRLIYALPIEGEVYEQYLGIQVTNVGESALDDLEFTAFLTLDPAGNKAYPDALPDFGISWPQGGE